jgi:cell division protease FtsH
MFLPEKDSYSISKRKLNSQVASLFGGRIAEELIYGADSVTTGASNDIERATKIAHKMVKQWGMSETLGPLAYGEEEGEVFLGRQVTKHKHISEDTFKIIDVEICKIIDSNYQVALKILKDNKDILIEMSKALMEFETIDKEQIDDLMNRKPIREAAVIVDSNVASTDLGSGVELDNNNQDSDEKPLSGDPTEQVA